MRLLKNFTISIKILKITFEDIRPNSCFFFVYKNYYILCKGYYFKKEELCSNEHLVIMI